MRLLLLLLTARMLVAAEIKEPPITAADSAHWSFAPLTRPTPPGTQGNPIDQFISARLA